MVSKDFIASFPIISKNAVLRIPCYVIKAHVMLLFTATCRLSNKKSRLLMIK